MDAFPFAVSTRDLLFLSPLDFLSFARSSTPLLLSSSSMGCGSSSAAGAGADVPTAAKPVDSQPTQQDTAGADATEAKKNDPSVAAPAPEESAAASSPPQAEVPVEKEAAPEAQAAAPEEAAPESAPAVVEPVAEVAAAADPVPVDAPAADAPVDAPVEADAPAAAEPAAESAAVSEPVSSPVEETPVTVVSTDGASSKSVKPQAVFVLGGPGSGQWRGQEHAPDDGARAHQAQS